MAFDDRFQFYQKISEEINQMQVSKDQEFLRVHMNSLQHSVQQHVTQWVDIYGKLLHESAKTNLYSLNEEILVSSYSNLVFSVNLLLTPRHNPLHFSHLGNQLCL